MEQNPWKTPFGRLIIVSAVLAAVIGFSMAAGMMTYFRSAAATDEVNSQEQATNLTFNDVAAVADDQSGQIAEPNYQELNIGSPEPPPPPQYYSGGSGTDTTDVDQQRATPDQTADQQQSGESDSNSEEQE